MEQKIFFEEKEVASVETTDEKTPLGDAVYVVRFSEGGETKMTIKKFTAMQTTEKSDATAARAALAKEVATKIYALFMEYGLKFSEIDPVINESLRLINDGKNAALDILWGNEAYDRSLLDVNRVLLSKYGEDTSTAEEVTENSDGTAPDGGSVDTENKE